MLIEPGQKISHYKIIEKLGEGGMGVVYKAHDTSLNRMVALKFLPPHLTKDESTRKRFVVEAQAASALDHPNICNIHEINETPDGQLYICMAFYEGETLREKIDSGSIPFDEAVNIFFHIVQGLKIAHEKNIVHRDIKPGNILITKNGEVKIVDFGLAKLAGIELTKTTRSKGTAAYMCPEQIRGQKIDHRCDIWALGIVFYEMLTGHLPFEAEYPEPMMYAIVNEEPKLLSHYLDNTTEALQDIINKLLKKDPSDRYPDMTEVLYDFQTHIKMDDSDTIITKSAFRRLLHRKKYYVYSALVILPILFFLFKSYLLPQYSGGNKIAVLPMTNISNSQEQDWFTDGMTDVLIGDLTQISGLRVISRTTIMKYKGTNKSPSEIAAELGIKYLVEASVLKSADHIKISARLIDALNDEYIWAENYDHELKDVLLLFGKVAQAIASEVEIKLSTQDQERFASVEPVNPVAYELYLKGNYYLNTGNHEDLDKAADYFNKTIELDSSYALAYVGLAACYGLYTYFGHVSREEGIAKIKKYIERALEIDENLADAYYSLGAFRLWQLWDWEGSGKAFSRAISINPNVSGILNTEYLWYLTLMNRYKKAIVEGERLLELDPLSPVRRNSVINIYYCARQYDKAIELGQRSIELDPENAGNYWQLQEIYEHLGQHDDAHKSRLSAMKLSGIKPEKIAYYDSLYTKLGPKAFPTWESLGKNDWFENAPESAARIYTRLGEKEKALEWLEKAYDKHVGALAALNSSPFWDPLREEPRFLDLLKRMNFPE